MVEPGDGIGGRRLAPPESGGPAPGGDQVVDESGHVEGRTRGREGELGRPDPTRDGGGKGERSLQGRAVVADSHVHILLRLVGATGRIPGRLSPSVL